MDVILLWVEWKNTTESETKQLTKHLVACGSLHLCVVDKLINSGVSNSLLEGHYSAEFSSNLPQYICLEASSNPEDLV